MTEPFVPIHPGELLYSVLMADRNWDANTVAKKSGLDIEFIDQLIAGKIDVTEEISKKLALAFNSNNGYFLRLQKSFDANLSQQKEIPKISSHEIILVALGAGGRSKLFERVQVQKIMFLIDREANKLLGVPFFDFKPHKYGPFDETVYNQLEELEKSKHVEFTQGKNNQNCYKLKQKGYDAGRKILLNLPSYMRGFLESTTAWVLNQDFESLVEAIYESYPDMKEFSVYENQI